MDLVLNNEGNGIMDCAVADNKQELKVSSEIDPEVATVGSYRSGSGNDHGRMWWNHRQYFNEYQCGALCIAREWEDEDERTAEAQK